MAKLRLHTLVIRDCSCCGIPNEFIFTSQSDQTVCTECRRHGQDSERKLVLHRDWWRQYVASVNAGHQSELQRLGDNVDRLSQAIDERDRKLAGMKTIALRGYSETSVGGIREWLQDGIVKDAEERMRTAYRSRDRVMSTLLRIRDLHHQSSKPDKCSCGKRAKECDIFQWLEPISRTLENWESKQVEFLVRQQPHQLPETHPKVIERNSRRAWDS